MWKDSAHLHSRISFPRETRHAMTLLMSRNSTRSDEAELVEEEGEHFEMSSVVPPPNTARTRRTEIVKHDSRSCVNLSNMPCPKNLLCERGFHDGPCDVKKKGKMT